jgi:hypothetical protein
MNGISARFIITTRRQKDHISVALTTVPSKGEAWGPSEYLFFTLPGGLGHSVLEQLLYDLSECERAESEQKSPEPLF